MRASIALAVLFALTACAGTKPKSVSAPMPRAHASTLTPPHVHTRPAFVPRGPYTAGGLYAPGVADRAPDVTEDISALPEPVPKNEPRSRYGNRTPYTVLGRTYNVLPSAKGYVERGVASWYGTKFDGRATSNFEPYDIYQFSGAHKTLPLPSYVRVTNLDNGRSAIVRINDRGPFHEGRLIDLSYAAAIKLGVNIKGTAPVEVRALDPGDADSIRSNSSIATTSTSDRILDANNNESVAQTRNAPAPATPTNPLPAPIASSRPMASAHAANPAAHPAGGYLQIASFVEPVNAQRLLARLRDAGIDGASLREADINGHALWRVVVVGLDPAAGARIADRIEALGLGHPAFFSATGSSD